MDRRAGTPEYWVHVLLRDAGDDRGREWRIWAAKHRQCPKCKQPPYKPCLNMIDVKHGQKKTRRDAQWPARRTADPHTERVDWALLETELRRRGYE